MAFVDVLVESDEDGVVSVGDLVEVTGEKSPRVGSDDEHVVLVEVLGYWLAREVDSREPPDAPLR